MGQRLQNFQNAAAQYKLLADRFVYKNAGGVTIATVDPDGPVIIIAGRPFTEQEATDLRDFLDFVLK